ncbi:MAG TPA: SRPBCC family protein [Verrucomicrobiae bacterium]|nr:SRPBCC family protein [Verrucomicrobiae bacterium]
MQDVITREITLKAPKERVYSAITDPEQITAWFPDKVEGTLEVGQKPTFHFGEYKTQLYIEAAKPHDYFAYRWVPGGGGMVEDILQAPNTLVEFFIEEQENGTKVTLKESGFAALPADIAKASFSDNSNGWDHMMSRLEKVISEE